MNFPFTECRVFPEAYVKHGGCQEAVGGACPFKVFPTAKDGFNWLRMCQSRRGRATCVLHGQGLPRVIAVTLRQYYYIVTGIVQTYSPI